MTKRLMSQVLLLAMSGSLLSPFAVRAETPLRFGEVAWAGSSLSTADEWLELWNLGDVEIALEGYRLEGASAEPLLFSSEHRIPAQSAFLITNYDTTDGKSALATSTPYVTTALSLSNSALTLRLIAPDETIVDDIPSGTPPAGSSTPKASMRWLQDHWETSTTTLFLKEGVADLGTPGYCDGCTAIETTSSTDGLILEEDSEAELEDAIVEEILNDTTSTEFIVTTTTDITTIITEPSTTTELVATSTEELIPTSTTPPATTTIVTTSTQEAPQEETPITTSTSSTIDTPTTTIPIVEQAIETSTVTPVEPSRLMLSTVYPAPLTNEKESITLRWITLSKNLASLDGWYLKNGRDRVIFRFSTSTRASVSSTEDEVRIGFRSSYLLNSGDTVSLYTTQHELVDRMTYTESIRGTTWTWSESGWISDKEEIQPLTLPTITSPETTSETSLTLPIPPIKTVVTSKTTTPSKTQSTTKPLSDKQTAQKKSLTTKHTATATKKSTTKKATAKATSANKTLAVRDSRIEDILMQPQPIRVRIRGVVGSVPGILAKRQVILHAPDGQGLLIKLRTGQKTPPLGSTLEITGTISEDDEGVMLTMKTNDTLRIIQEEPTSIPSRIIDLFAEETEDQWSKITVTGTVMTIKGTTAELNVDGTHLFVTIKPATRYRSQRLQKEDLLRITGLIQFGKESPTLLPIQSDDIIVLEHATKRTPVSQTTFPDWLPFGAAGITAAAYEGLKRWKKRKPQLMAPRITP